MGDESLRRYSLTRRFKFVSMVMLFVFVMTSMIDLRILSAQTQSISPLPSLIQIPEHIGTIQKSIDMKKTGTPFIIHVQDAHLNYEAQKNVSAILRTVHTQYGVDRFFIEGADAKIDPSLLRAFPVQEVKKKIVDQCVKEGKLTGAEEYAIMAPAPVTLLGVDDREMYVQNVMCYGAASKVKDSAHSFLTDTQAALAAAQPQIVSQALNEYLHKSEAFFKQEIEPLEYTRYLIDVAHASSIDFSRYTHFSKLAELQVFQSKIEADKIYSETRAFIDQELLQKELVIEDSDLLMLAELDFHGERITPYEYYRTLKRLALTYEIDFRSYENINRYYHYLMLVNEIDARALLIEREKLEAKIVRRLTKTSAEKEFIALTKHFVVLKNLINLQAIPEDLTYFRKHEKAFVDGMFDLEGAPPRRQTAAFSIEKALPVFKKFYALAEGREDAFISQALQSMKDDSLHSAVLLTGGYHSRGLEERFGKAGVSYVVVSPRLTTLPHDNLYDKVMRSYDKYFGVTEGERAGTVAPLSRLMQGQEGGFLFQGLLNDIVPEMTRELMDVAAQLEAGEVFMNQLDLNGKALEFLDYVQVIDEDVDAKKTAAIYFNMLVKAWNFSVKKYSLLVSEELASDDYPLGRLVIVPTDKATQALAANNGLNLDGSVRREGKLRRLEDIVNEYDFLRSDVTKQAVPKEVEESMPLSASKKEGGDKGADVAENGTAEWRMSALQREPFMLEMQGDMFIGEAWDSLASELAQVGLTHVNINIKRSKKGLDARLMQLAASDIEPVTFLGRHETREERDLALKRYLGQDSEYVFIYEIKDYDGMNEINLIKALKRVVANRYPELFQEGEIPTIVAPKPDENDIPAVGEWLADHIQKLNDIYTIFFKHCYVDTSNYRALTKDFAKALGRDKELKDLVLSIRTYLSIPEVQKQLRKVGSTEPWPERDGVIAFRSGSVFNPKDKTVHYTLGLAPVKRGKLPWDRMKKPMFHTMHFNAGSMIRSDLEIDKKNEDPTNYLYHVTVDDLRKLQQPTIENKRSAKKELKNVQLFAANWRPFNSGALLGRIGNAIVLAILRTVCAVSLVTLVHEIGHIIWSRDIELPGETSIAKGLNIVKALFITGEIEYWEYAVETPSAEDSIKSYVVTRSDDDLHKASQSLYNVVRKKTTFMLSGMVSNGLFALLTVRSLIGAIQSGENVVFFSLFVGAHIAAIFMELFVADKYGQGDFVKSGRKELDQEVMKVMNRFRAASLVTKDNEQYIYRKIARTLKRFSSDDVLSAYERFIDMALTGDLGPGDVGMFLDSLVENLSRRQSADDEPARGNERDIREDAGDVEKEVWGQSVKNHYEKDERGDEYMPATVLVDEDANPIGRINKEDGVVFFNFRADRARQISRAFVNPDFDEFETDDLSLDYITMTEYESGLVPTEKIAYPLPVLERTLSDELSNAGKTQFHIAETQKFYHVTFFLNGRREGTISGEEHLLVPSPDVGEDKPIKSFAHKPEMSAPEIAEEAVHRIETKADDFIALNFANLDMVGHENNFEAVKKAVVAVDGALEKVAQVAVAQGYNIIVTADHGNAEEMWNYKTNQGNKKHTTNKVPFVFIPSPTATVADEASLHEDGRLADVAPSILKTLGIEQPTEMNGTSLLNGVSYDAPHKEKTMLIVLDGWGYNPNREDAYDAVRVASEEGHTPFLDSLSKEPLRTLLTAHGVDVGLPAGIMGNSEVGHGSLGSGRDDEQSLVTLNKQIQSGEFFTNEALVILLRDLKKKGKSLHIMGMTSEAGVHSSLEHMYALLELAKKEGLEEVYIHGILDGRDTGAKDAIDIVPQMLERISQIGVGTLVDLIGRAYAMDRDEDWSMIEKAYRMYVDGASSSTVSVVMTEDASDVKDTAQARSLLMKKEGFGLLEFVGRLFHELNHWLVGLLFGLKVSIHDLFDMQRPSYAEVDKEIGELGKFRASMFYLAGIVPVGQLVLLAIGVLNDMSNLYYLFLGAVAIATIVDSYANFVERSDPRSDWARLRNLKKRKYVPEFLTAHSLMSEETKEKDAALQFERRMNDTQEGLPEWYGSLSKLEKDRLKKDVVDIFLNTPYTMFRDEKEIVDYIKLVPDPRVTEGDIKAHVMREKEPAMLAIDFNREFNPFYLARVARHMVLSLAILQPQYEEQNRSLLTALQKKLDEFYLLSQGIDPLVLKQIEFKLKFHEDFRFFDCAALINDISSTIMSDSARNAYQGATDAYTLGQTPDEIAEVNRTILGRERRAVQSVFNAWRQQRMIHGSQAEEVQPAMIYKTLASYIAIRKLIIPDKPNGQLVSLAVEWIEKSRDGNLWAQMFLDHFVYMAVATQEKEKDVPTMRELLEFVRFLPKVRHNSDRMALLNIIDHIVDRLSENTIEVSSKEYEAVERNLRLMVGAYVMVNVIDFPLSHEVRYKAMKVLRKVVFAYGGGADEWKKVHDIKKLFDKERRKRQARAVEKEQADVTDGVHVERTQDNAIAQEDAKAQAVALSESLPVFLRPLLLSGLLKDGSDAELWAEVKVFAQILMQYAIDAKVVRPEDADVVQSFLVGILADGSAFHKKAQNVQARGYKTAFALAYERVKVIAEYGAENFLKDELFEKAYDAVIVYASEKDARLASQKKKVAATASKALGIPKSMIRVMVFKPSNGGVARPESIIGRGVMQQFAVVTVYGAYEKESLFHFEAAAKDLWDTSGYSIKNKVRLLAGDKETAVPFATVLAGVKQLFDVAESTAQKRPVFSEEAKAELGFYLLNSEAMQGLLTRGAFIADSIAEKIKDKLKQAIMAEIVQTFA